MKSKNRLEETPWTPDWDLGLQVEFDFAPDGGAAQEQPSPTRTGWSRAGAEILGRSEFFDRRLALESGSLGSLLAYFESAFAMEGGSDE